MGSFDIVIGRSDQMLAGGGLFGRSDGMSPLTMGVLGLLAFKAIQSLNRPGRGSNGDWLRTTFGYGGNPGTSRDAGGILSGGLRDLVGQFQQSGHGDVAKSWIGTGANRQITPDILAKVLTEDQIATLMAHTGMRRADLLSGMSDELPAVVDKLTPDGEVPTREEMHEVIDHRPA